MFKMPSFAVYNNQIITPTDIYKFGIDKSGPFYCFKCDKKIQFRQSRNADNNYTEHFYHPNTAKDTHIECENLTLDKVKDTDTWHNMLSDFIYRENREIVRKTDTIKHIVDAYDDFNDDNIRIANDIDTTEKVDENLHYVALTRGMKYIVSDNSAAISTIQTKISNMLV